MPLSDNVDHARRLRSVSGHYETRGGGGKGKGQDGRDSASSGRRVGFAIELQDTANSLLSPIMSHLPSLPSIPSLKGFLPVSPAKSSTAVGLINLSAEGVRAVWQEGDLDDGQGCNPLLLVLSRSHALQIFTYRNNVIPNDPHVPEAFSPPEEACSIPKIRYDSNTEHTNLPGVVRVKSAGLAEHVLSAELLQKSDAWKESGPVVAFTTLTPLSGKSSTLGALALVIVALRTGVATRRVDLGLGTGAEAISSPRVLVVTTSHPTPSIHLFHPVTLSPLSLPLTELPVNPRTYLPVISLSGRLMAYSMSDAPNAPGPEGLGSVVTASSLRSSHHRSSSSSSRSADKLSSSHDQPQAALLSSAVEMGGGVARGVWAGIKMGAKAAGRARNSRLARSAPADSGSVAYAGGEEAETIDSESRSLDDSSVFDESPPVPPPGGSWIRIVDLSKAQRHTSEGLVVDFQTVAHFRLPPASSTVPLDHSAMGRGTTSRPYDALVRPITKLSFSPSGTRLFAAPSDGKSFHVLDIHPAGVFRPSLRAECKGEVWHQYELRRGHTSSTVSHVKWDRSGRWIGVATDRGTVHVFPISPFGGPAVAKSHASLKIVNSHLLQGLSTVVMPIVRLRPTQRPSPVMHESAVERVDPSMGATFDFMDFRRHPVTSEQYCQDIVIFRPLGTTLELARLAVHAINRADSQATSTLQSRGSALTEMMRAKTFGSHGDLGADAMIKARWTLPSENDNVVLVGTANPIPHRVTLERPRMKNLAHAEIQTHCLSARVLPSSIYLSPQIEFYAARPIDDYSPLSIIDIEARMQRLPFHHEVEARTSSPLVKSFDEPLSTALHSYIETRPISQVPGLPNGYPSRAKWHNSIPIRTVTAGLGEGVDRVRREYVRAQHSRMRRRLSQAAANQLSFEDDAVFASGPEDGSGDGDGEYNSGSSPSSGMLPTTNTESSLAGDDRDAEADEWGDKWEDEYRRAVEDDGGPEELVLGLMDEEEEESRKWELRQKTLAKQWPT